MKKDLRPLPIDLLKFVAAKARQSEVRRFAEALARRVRHQRLQYGRVWRTRVVNTDSDSRASSTHTSAPSQRMARATVLEQLRRFKQARERAPG